MNEKKITGDKGEQLAADFLEENGYCVICRNFKTRLGEIDIIAENSGYVIFVEVKTRKSNSFASACEYVGTQKQQRIIKTAAFWLNGHRTSKQPRFDVIEVYYSNGFDSFKINHICDAFQC